MDKKARENSDKKTSFGSYCTWEDVSKCSGFSICPRKSRMRQTKLDGYYNPCNFKKGSKFFSNCPLLTKLKIKKCFPFLK